MDRREVLAGAGAALTLSLAGCTLSSTTPADQPTVGDGIVDVERGDTVTHTFGSAFEIRDYGWTDRELDYGTPGAAGVLENVADQRLAQASLAVDFYDGDTQIDNNTNWLTFIEPGEFGTLEVPFTGDDPSRVSRVAVSASVLVDPVTPLNDGAVSVDDGDVGTTENGHASLPGTVANTTDERLERVLITANFYDGDEILGWARDAVTRLGADESGEWEVVAGGFDPAAVTRHSVVVQVQR